MKTVPDRLREVCEQFAQGNQTAFARRLGRPQPSVNQILSGRSEKVDASLLADVSREFGVDAGWLVTGEGEMVRAPQAVFAGGVGDGGAVYLTMPLATRVERALGRLPEATRGGQQVAVPIIRGVPVVGGPPPVYYPEVIDDGEVPELVTAPWVLARDRPFAVEVMGDSMSPLFDEGDVVVASLNSTAPRGKPAIIEFDEGPGTLSWRLKSAIDLGDGRGLLVSQNAAYPPEFVQLEQIRACYPILGILRRTPKLS